MTDGRSKIGLARAIKTNAFELLFAVTATAFGVAMSTSKAWGWAAGGAVLATMGGVLASLVLTRLYAGEEAVSRVAARISGLNRQVGATALQLSEVLTQARLGYIDAETCQYTIEQASRTLYGLAREVEQAIGGGFDSQALVTSVTELGELVDQMLQLTAGADAQGSTAQLLSDELVLVRSSLEQLQSRLSKDMQPPARSFRNESVDCPRCADPVAVTIGTLPGDSAAPTCPHCGLRFHAHRNVAGGTFTRLPGPGAANAAGQTAPAALATVPMSVPPSEVELSCPSCDVTVPVHPNASSPALRWCLRCFHRLVIDIGARRAFDGGHEPPLDGSFPETGGRTSIICPDCGGKFPTFSRIGSCRFATCAVCSRLLRAIEGDDVDAVVDGSP